MVRRGAFKGFLKFFVVADCFENLTVADGVPRLVGRFSADRETDRFGCAMVGAEEGAGREDPPAGTEPLGADTIGGTTWSETVAEGVLEPIGAAGLIGAA